MDVASELNKDVVTDFPILDAVGKLEPGVYLVTAKPWKGAKRARAARAATRATTASGDAMDGRLRPRADGVLRRRRRSCARAFARDRRAARGRRVEARRAQQRSAGDQDDGRRRARRFRSRPVARDRRIGARPAGRDARRRLRLPQSGQSAFDLTDRGVAGRDAPSALDAFLYTERGVYRSGETVFVTALLRDAKGEAKTGLPLTLVVKRPDGVEYKRAKRRRPGARRARLRRAAALRRGGGQMDDRGLRRPEGAEHRARRVPARGLYPRAARFRAEDREADGRSPASRSNSRSTRNSSMARRRAGSTSPARSASRRWMALRSPAFPAMSPAWPTTNSARSRTSSATRSQTDEKGHADLSVELPEGSAANRSRRS